MTKLDQFESVFRAASKVVFEYERIAINSVLVVTDQEGDAAAVHGMRRPMPLSWLISVLWAAV